MCGIFGWQFKNNLPSTDVLGACLSIQMQGRGGHSWGVYSPENNKLHKGIGEIADSLKRSYFSGKKCLFAHTRHGTTGSISRKNAHPFRFDRIVGAHNGMVSNHNQLNRWYNRKCQVDSQHIFLHLLQQEYLGEIEAYGTIEYAYTDQPGRVYLCSFNGGDLAVYQVQDKGVVWASTDKAVRQSLKMAGLKGKSYSIEEAQLYFVEEGQLWKAGETKFDFDKYAPQSTNLTRGQDEYELEMEERLSREAYLVE